MGISQGDVGGAGAVAVDDGRQPLHMGAQHLGHRLLFGLAQLRELRGDVGDRAVMLADLHPRQRTADPRGGGGVARLGEGFGDPFGVPLQSVETVLPFGGDRLLVANDNNFPDSDGRNAGRPDDLEAIVIEAPGLE